jgi:hypothetical protein
MVEFERAVPPQELRARIERDGGFTLDIATGQPADDGISVAAGRSIAMTFPQHEWCDRSVERWLHEAAHHRPLRRSHLGGWLDRSTGYIWLDLVWVIDRRLAPLAPIIGRALRQHCVFDLTRGTAVPLHPRRGRH